MIDRDNPPDEPGTGIDRTARRRLLVKAVGKGTALAAAATPIKTLAASASVTDNGRICTVSGVQSAAASAHRTGLPVCGSYSPGYFMKIEHWPGCNKLSKASPSYSFQSLSLGSISFNSGTPFSGVFGGGLNVGLLTLMNNNPSSAEFHWAAALLSALGAPSGTVYPYAPGQVVDLYNSPQQAAALAFFKTVMEGSQGV